MVRRRIASEKEMDRVGLRKCIRPLLEGSPPGQDGMRYALFPFSWTVSGDFFRLRVLRAPDLTVVPSRCSPAKPGRKTIDFSVVVGLKQRLVGAPDTLLPWPVPPRPSSPAYWL